MIAADRVNRALGKEGPGVSLSGRLRPMTREKEKEHTPKDGYVVETSMVAKLSMLACEWGMVREMICFGDLLLQ
jgi:hypothetical protein